MGEAGKNEKWPGQDRYGRVYWWVRSPAVLPGKSIWEMSIDVMLHLFEPATRAILDQRRDIFAQRRDYLLPELEALGFDIPQRPDGAFYIYAGIQRFSDNSQQFCMHLLEQHGVAITPGADFGDHQADSHVRFSYTTDLPRIEAAVARMKRVLG